MSSYCAAFVSSLYSLRFLAVKYNITDAKYTSRPLKQHDALLEYRQDRKGCSAATPFDTRFSTRFADGYCRFRSADTTSAAYAYIRRNILHYIFTCYQRRTHAAFRFDSASYRACKMTPATTKVSFHN